jgi:hypothetical protein
MNTRAYSGSPHLEVGVWYGIGMDLSSIARKLWNGRHVSMFVLLATALSCVWFYFHPSTGAAIAVLGAVAAVMSIREMSPLEKFCGIVVVFGLLFVELRSIRRDDDDRKEARRQEVESFKAIATELTAAINQSQDQFSATMSHFGVIQAKTEAAADLSKRNLESVTGVDSYAWVTPQVWSISAASAVPLAIHNYGPNMLTGVTVQIMDMAAFDSVPFDETKVMEQMYFGPRINIGALPPFDGQTLPQALPPMSFGKDGKHAYGIEISSQSGVVHEAISFRRSTHPKQSGMLAFLISAMLQEHHTGKFTRGRELEYSGWSDEEWKGARHKHH